MDAAEIARAFRAAAKGLMAEVRRVDESLAMRLESAVLELCDGARD